MTITAFVGIPGCADCDGFCKGYANATIAHVHAEDRLRMTILKQDTPDAIEKATESVAVALERRYTAREAVHAHQESHSRRYMAQ
jgi:hypothetical protein